LFVAAFRLGMSRSRSTSLGVTVIQARADFRMGADAV